MRWFLLPLLFVVAVSFGGSYASALITRMIGPWSSTAIHQDGSTSLTRFDVNLPRPEWLPVIPGATVVQAAKIVTAQAPSGFHSLDLATRASVDEVKSFYTQRLAAAGFEVEDLGLMSLNPMTARFLGIAGALTAKRAASDDRFDMQIRTSDGLIPSRMLQIHWRKISDTPDLPAPPQQAAGG
jgi:hypothetical protein